MKTFSKLDPEKQQKILDAACIEFAQKGYELASTNEIVKNAQISKGMLFYYFGSKQKLYQFLVEKVMNMLDEMIEKMDISEPDLLKRYYLLALNEMLYYHQYSSLFTFMGSLNKNPMDLLQPDMVQRVQETIILFRNKIDNTEGIDYKLFQEGSNVQQVIQLIQYAIKGYEQELTIKMMNMDITQASFDDEMKKFEDFLQVLRNQFYRRTQE